MKPTSPGTTVRGTRRELNEVFGELELRLVRAFAFFDTYMDILTQRQSPVLGPLLAGCDVLALDAIRKLFLFGTEVGLLVDKTSETMAAV